MVLDEISEGRVSHEQEALMYLDELVEHGLLKNVRGRLELSAVGRKMCFTDERIDISYHLE